MNSITLDGVTFRWDGQELLVTTVTSQKRLTGSSAATLLDFLLAIQQDLYTAEQARELPTWAHPPRTFVNGQVSEEEPSLRLISGTVVTSKPDGQEEQESVSFPCPVTIRSLALHLMIVQVETPHAHCGRQRVFLETAPPYQDNGCGVDRQT